MVQLISHLENFIKSVLEAPGFKVRTVVLYERTVNGNAHTTAQGQHTSIKPMQSSSHEPTVVYTLRHPISFSTNFCVFLCCVISHLYPVIFPLTCSVKHCLPTSMGEGVGVREGRRVRVKREKAKVRERWMT